MEIGHAFKDEAVTIYHSHISDWFQIVKHFSRAVQMCFSEYRAYIWYINFDSIKRKDTRESAVHKWWTGHILLMVNQNF